MTSRWKQSKVGQKWKRREEMYDRIGTVLGFGLSALFFYGIYRLVKFIWQIF